VSEETLLKPSQQINGRAGYRSDAASNQHFNAILDADSPSSGWSPHGGKLIISGGDEPLLLAMVMRHSIRDHSA
jgi:hypothetical protein